MEHLRSLRFGRRILLASVALMCALVAAQVLFFYSLIGTVGASCAVAVSLVNVRLSGKRIVKAQKALRRPDYSRIATLERDIFGETFHHDGAPETGGIRAEGQFTVTPNEVRRLDGYPIASSAELAAAMAALGEMTRNASVSIGPLVRDRCPRGHPASEMYWSQQQGAFCNMCDEEEA
jgi:hypothetical protein